MKKKTYYIALDTEYVRKSSGKNRLLSWQYCISTDATTLLNYDIKIFKDKEERPKLQEIILNAFKDSGIKPEELAGSHIIVICHYCPAEIAMLTDKLGGEKVYDLKFLLNNMTYLRKTVAALKEQRQEIPTSYRIENSEERKKCTFTYEFFDTQLIAPAGAATLEHLSKALEDKEFHKKDLHIYEKSHMDWLLEHKEKKFREYAINDAKATMKAFIELQKNFNRLENNNKEFKIKRTIGSAALDYYESFIKEKYSLKPKNIIGKGTSTEQATHDKFSESYHGGRNETYYIGKAPEEYIYFDIDYKNAYPTCLSMLYGINWDIPPKPITSMKQLLNIKNIHKYCTYIQARFEFLKNPIYPCLPDFHQKYGLLYPIKGTTYTTAHEILLAHKMGAKIDIINGGILTPKENYENYFYPFKEFYTKIIKERDAYPKKSMMNLLYKEYANTLYGKVAQNVSEKRTYDLFGTESKEIGDSKISSPAFASNITGLMRAALGELLYTCEVLNKEKNETIYLPLNAVTDGALIGVKKSSFSAETLKLFEDYNSLDKKQTLSLEDILPDFIKELKKSNLIEEIRKTREEIATNDTFLEIKSISNKVWTFKTRGSVGYYNETVTMLTKAGHKPPEIQDDFDTAKEKDKDEYKIIVGGKEKRYIHKYFRPRTQEETARWLLKVYYSYPEITTYDMSRLTSLKDLINTNEAEDIVQIIKSRKSNLDFDYKRRPNFEEEYPDIKSERKYSKENLETKKHEKIVLENDYTSELMNLNTLPFESKNEMLKWRTAAETLRNSSYIIFGERTNGYRATPTKVHAKVFEPVPLKDGKPIKSFKVGEKGLKGVMTQYTIQAYVKGKLPAVPCTHNGAQIERIFLDKRFYTHLSKKAFIDRKIVYALKKKVFVPTRFPNNSFNRAWIRKTLKQLKIEPSQDIFDVLLSK